MHHKENLDDYIRYANMRENHLKILTDQDFIKFALEWLPNDGDGYLIMEVEESGKGYLTIVNSSGMTVK